MAWVTKKFDSSACFWILTWRDVIPKQYSKLASEQVSDAWLFSLSWSSCADLAQLAVSWQRDEEEATRGSEEKKRLKTKASWERRQKLHVMKTFFLLQVLHVMKTFCSKCFTSMRFTDPTRTSMTPARRWTKKKKNTIVRSGSGRNIEDKAMPALLLVDDSFGDNDLASDAPALRPMLRFQ